MGFINLYFPKRTEEKKQIFCEQFWRLRHIEGKNWETYLRIYVFIQMTSSYSLTIVKSTYRTSAENLYSACMSVSSEKTQFFKTQVELIGFLISKNGIKISKDKVEDITNYVINKILCAKYVPFQACLTTTLHEKLRYDSKTPHKISWWQKWNKQHQLF